MFKTTQALVLREVRYKEADRILTLFTATDGKITAKARGALRKSSRTAAATQQLTYGEMTLFENRGKWTVNEASVIEGFAGLREDIAAFSLGSYFAECLEALSIEDQPDPAMLQLGLNSLYALSRGLYDPLQIKAAFELRLMCLAGYEPDLRGCPVCGKEQPEDPILGLDHGGICCRSCRRADFGAGASLCDASLAALRYVAFAPAKQLFSFHLEDGALTRLSDAAERYLQAHTERRFSTLDYWKRVRGV
ncbi:MAG: DNA repair protein RecO [Oscillospiraceae bacterium]|nr:DNA repair protein RecO [Oscillospiraceae bacterium]